MSRGARRGADRGAVLPWPLALPRRRRRVAAGQRVHWYEFVLRFLLGGLVTLATGIVAERAGIDCRIRGRKAAGLDAAGAALGGWGLVCFGLIAWRELPAHAPMLVLSLAALGWLTLAMLLWRVLRLHVVGRIRAGARRS